MKAILLISHPLELLADRVRVWVSNSHPRALAHCAAITTACDLSIWTRISTRATSRSSTTKRPQSSTRRSRSRRRSTRSRRGAAPVALRGCWANVSGSRARLRGGGGCGCSGAAVYARVLLTEKKTPFVSSLAPSRQQTRCHPLRWAQRTGCSTSSRCGRPRSLARFGSNPCLTRRRALHTPP